MAFKLDPSPCLAICQLVRIGLTRDDISIKATWITLS